MWAYPASKKAAVYACIFCVLVCDVWLLLVSAAEEFPAYRCPLAGDTSQHERFIDTLNGTRIVFIGDSVTRFQYISLATFLINGLCPDKETEPRRKEYEQLYYVSNWDSFYKGSSAALTSAVSSETCTCAREEFEFRSFIYQDEQGRRIDLEFMMYMNENQQRMDVLWKGAINMAPTHIVMNYGLWLLHTYKTCGQNTDDECPYVPKVCEFLTGEHPFQVIWQTTTPKQAQENWPLSAVSDDHHLHIPRVCNLPPSSVINRGELLRPLEAEGRTKAELHHDDAHFTPAPSHAFNGYLVEMIATERQGHGRVVTDDPVEQAPATGEQQLPDKGQAPATDEQHPPVESQPQLFVAPNDLESISRLRAALG